MTETIEGGATFAWRVLATLEGGSLLLATSALLVYTARARVVKRTQRSINNVLVTNTTSTLGKELKCQLELHGCSVRTLEATYKPEVGTIKNKMEAENDRFDALIMIGAEVTSDGLDGLAGLVTEDIYNNLKLLEESSIKVKPGGCIAWVSTGRTRGSFSVTETAFDAVLQASLKHFATVASCEPIWVGRCSDVQRAAERVLAALYTFITPQHSTFSLRNAATKASTVVCRWLKIIS